MEVLYVILLLVIIVILINNHYSLNGKIEQLEGRIFDLNALIRELKLPKPLIAEQKPEPKPQETFKPIAEKAPEPPKSVVPKPPEPEIEYHKEIISDPLDKLKNSTLKTIDEPQPVIKPKQSFFEKYPDLEKFIGENLVNKIGIAILVLAIAFFVKYAIDNNWVGPAGRVGIGILCGGILIGIAHRLRKTYKAFSSVLVGGGLAVFYFTITLAFHEFHLFSQTAAFIILIVVTCFAVALSLLYNKQELAVIALVGGMASPFMVSNGNANYNALFIYLLTLNVGLLVVAYNKSWRILNISAFGLTVLVLSGIVYSLPAGAYFVSFIYISVLYLVFFLINIAYNIRANEKFAASDFTILLINTALYFSTGFYLLTMLHDEQFRGLFCAGIAALNLVFSFFLFKSKRADINILYLLIAITLTFLSLAAPVQLHGHFITLFWSAESVLLYWLYQKSSIKVMRTASVIVWFAMLLSLMMDWYEIYGDSGISLTIIANKGFITTLFSAICSWLLYLLAIKPNANKLALKPTVYEATAVLLLFASGALEINHQFLNHYPDTDLNYLYLMLYLPAFVYIFFSLVTMLKPGTINWRFVAWKYAGVILIYFLMMPQFFALQEVMLTGHKIAATHFIAHWVSAGFTLLLFYGLISIARNNMQQYIKPFSWFISAAIVVFFSLEIGLLSNSIFYSPSASPDYIQGVYIKTGLPVLWGLSSFALMWLGMHYKVRVLRIISLVLFTLTLIKLFAFDIVNIPAAGKIAAFFCLGVLLLIISFMYQKVKVIITDDEKPAEK